MWARLRDPTIHRPHRIVAWRVLHATLGCRAFLAHVRVRAFPSQVPPDAAFCLAAGCRGGDVVDTITHALMDCPSVRPAIEWLGAVWAALAGSGNQVPLTPAVILADDMRRWPGAPATTAEVALWTRLRVATLGAIWHLRCQPDPGDPAAGSFARRAAAAAQGAVLAAIRRDWQRTHTDLRTLDAGGRWCQDWWRGLDTRICVDKFIAVWASPAYLCEVVGDPPHGGGRDLRTLTIRLGAGVGGVGLPQ